MTERELAEMLRNNPDLRVEGLAVPPNHVEPGSRLVYGCEVIKRNESSSLSEHDLQSAVIAECDRRSILRVEYGLIYAIPNGQYRQGQRMEPGLRKGIPDMFLPCARGGYHGLYIELKCGTNKPSSEQLRWLDNLRSEGYRCLVIWDSVDDVIREIEQYLESK